LFIEKCNKGLKGEITIPADKSISHRAVICGALAKGETIIENILLSEDVLNTIDCFRQMGVNIEKKNNRLIIQGAGLYGFKKPISPLNCGNSGTTMRLLSGILVGQNFPTSLIGDSSLMNRPMKRIIFPLGKMGANIIGRDGEYPPLTIEPTEVLNGIIYELPIASAQVKSSILLASLYASGETKTIENKSTRDHTERMLNYFGQKVSKNGNDIIINEKQNLIGKELFIPGDISSAAFLIAAATLVENSNIIIKNVGINPTRSGILEILDKMGGNIKVYNKRTVNNEPIGDIEIKYSPLKGCVIEGDIVGRLIDELPIVAVLAALAEGETTIRDAEELRYKETDRIKAMALELRKMGVEIKELSDGMIINGVKELRAEELNSYGDHRIAMALSIAALRAEGKSFINGSEIVNVSYPDFYKDLNYLVGNI
jgi:3-phosphoshikimate 1-carboxyvinyltransferase